MFSLINNSTQSSPLITPTSSNQFSRKNATNSPRIEQWRQGCRLGSIVATDPWRKPVAASPLQIKTKKSLEWRLDY
jgi:hypothetical protein